MALRRIRRSRCVDDEEVIYSIGCRQLCCVAYLRVANTQPKSAANASAHSHLECEVPTHASPHPRDGAASARAGEAAGVLGLAWGLLRVVQFKCNLPEACFSALEPTEVPAESRFLLEFDFDSLYLSSFEKQSSWVRAMKAAQRAGRRTALVQSRRGASARRREA